MDRLDAMRLFVRVVEHGSFSAVAQEAGLGQSAVSKQIAALEAHLGAQLLRRTSRSMTLTDAGQVFYESALRVVDEFDAAESLVGRGQSAPSGLVRVTIAPVFGRLYIVPRLPEFFARYPDISIELTGSGRNINLIEEGVDLAIRNGELTDSSMIARRIAMALFATVGTPAYLAVHGVPPRPRRPRCPHLPDFLSAPRAAAVGVPGRVAVHPASPEGEIPHRRRRTDPRRGTRRPGPCPQPGLEVRVRDCLGRGPRRAGRLRPRPAGHQRRPPRQPPLAHHKVRVFIDFLVEILAGAPALTERLS